MSEKWLSESRQTKAPTTVNRRASSLKAWAKWAGIEDFLKDYNLPKAARGIPHPIPEGLDGVVALCKIAENDELRALCALGGMVGLRVSESRSIRPEHFDLHDMMLKFEGKGSKERILPLSKRAWENIRPAYEKACQNGGPLINYTDRGARAAITRLGEKLGMRRGISSHDLRATIATAMFDSTKDILVVQEILGHSSVETTQIYTQVNMKRMREALEF